MMQDPYRTLGVSPSATDDEIKKAYRTLAKKYHPDVNNGDSSAETRMKEINEAYSAIMKMRREGPSGGGYGGSYSGGYGASGASYGYSGQSANPQMQAARNYIRSGYYQEAATVLEGIQERTAEWYYLFGEASLGMGNRIAALNYAQQAVAMDPNRLEYRMLLNRIQSGAQYYQNRGAQQGYDMSAGMCADPVSCCMTQLLFNLLCNCCCGFGRGC